jgi:hypothetical protein
MIVVATSTPDQCKRKHLKRKAPCRARKLLLSKLKESLECSTVLASLEVAGEPVAGLNPSQEELMLAGSFCLAAMEKPIV